MSLSVKKSLVCLLAVFAVVACGDDDGGAGVGGGGDNDSGTADYDSGINDPDSGASATGGTGGAGATSGSGGSGGTGATSGTGGTGGGSPCATDCNDSVDCTTDSCEAGVCVHVIDPTACDATESCHPMRGCEAGAACSTMSPCATTDACMANVTCNSASARCEWDALDGDMDGQSPVVCGGGDCDDSVQTTHPGAVDTCNGDDDDCDTTIDEDAACDSGNSCVDGACVCPQGKNVCSGECVDRQTSSDHCGRCGNSCGEAGVCVDGACTCPSPGDDCSTGPLTSACVNTNTSHNNCGACGTICARLEYCTAGACQACGAMGQPCCGTSSDGLSGGDGCPGADLLCVGTRESSTSLCTCPSDHLLCNGSCIDPKVNNTHCGACGNVCSPGLLGSGVETCVEGACVACGEEVGQPCCETGSLTGGSMLSCGGGLILLSCDQDTKLCRRGIF